MQTHSYYKTLQHYLASSLYPLAEVYYFSDCSLPCGRITFSFLGLFIGAGWRTFTILWVKKHGKYDFKIHVRRTHRGNSRMHWLGGNKWETGRTFKITLLSDFSDSSPGLDWILLNFTNHLFKLKRTIIWLITDKNNKFRKPYLNNFHTHHDYTQDM